MQLGGAGALQSDSDGIRLEPLSRSLQACTFLRHSGAFLGSLRIMRLHRPEAWLSRRLRSAARSHGTVRAKAMLVSASTWCGTRIQRFESRGGGVHGRCSGTRACRACSCLTRIQTPFAPALNFSLSILEGEAAVRCRMRRGPIKGESCLQVSRVIRPHSMSRRFERKRPGDRHLCAQKPSHGRRWSRSSTTVARCSARGRL